MIPIRIYEELCKGVDECGICLYVCPKGVFKPSEAFNAKGYHPPLIFNADQCSQCENCMIFCPDMAIVVKGDKRKRGSQR